MTLTPLQRGGRGGGRGHFQPGSRTDYSAIDKHNERYESYYNELGIIEDSERGEFWAALRRELPISFRFTGSRGHALTVQQRLIDHYIPEITSVTFNGEPVDPPEPVSWFPDKLAWSMTTTKNVIRKCKPFASFQKFLVSETSVGNISRQEVVSMIPPLLLDVRPGMTVLDLCAAPGSKSAQLIEAVHGGEEARVRKVVRDLAKERGRELSPDGMETDLEKQVAEAENDWSDDGRSTGLLIANDMDYRRAQMLIHQVKRLNSPNLIVTNHNATFFPSVRIFAEGGKTRYLKFDRILADVPCSGDGTTRKNIAIWKDWLPGNSLGLHITQQRILVRALQMLKVGGRVVYSTCSMNPVENEAVVASAIERCGGMANVDVVDCSDMLPGLKRRPGMTSWRVMDKAAQMFDSWAEVEEYRVSLGEDDNDSTARLAESMFPPTPSDQERIPLERCWRIYPHLQDTGGFFITVLEKKTEIKARNESEPKKEISPKEESEPKESEPKKVDQTSIVDVINEIESKTEPQNNNGSAVEKLKTLDAIAPPQVDPANHMDDGNAPATQRQDRPSSPPKRPLDDSPFDGGRSPKRTRNDVDTYDYTPPPSAPVSYDKVGKRGGNVHEEAFKYLDPSHPELLRIYDFYELSERFPRDRFMVRNEMGEPVKAIYYTSELAKRILTLNEGKGIKFVHCGVKMFMKQDAQGRDICRWRIQTEGLPVVQHWVGDDRVVYMHKRETLRKLLIEMFPRVANDGWKELGEIGERVRDIAMGCCVLRVDTSDAEDGFKERLVLPLWKSISSVNLMLPKEERRAMLLRLFNDQTELQYKGPRRDEATFSEAANENGVIQEPGTLAAGQDPETRKGSGLARTSQEDEFMDGFDTENGYSKPRQQAEQEVIAEAEKAIGVAPTLKPESDIERLETEEEAQLQHEADTTKEVQPGETVKEEEDVFNTTV
ncbi:hypothetical protein BDY21DRAFT_283543 [Lineolata rhizophorae]|uniref:SAM-dependent MTase RsmB/NOP-type domain-containing protein n=1 Tax=Lineolata rhizophorae TaxID=578093 RepID=A0A6A6P3S8_9PEZI|nr:hypothetical protein BDY21DRAFT_283543 [Lineolata rhizophorae]